MRNPAISTWGHPEARIFYHRRLRQGAQWESKEKVRWHSQTFRSPPTLMSTVGWPYPPATQIGDQQTSTDRPFDLVGVVALSRPINSGSSVTLRHTSTEKGLDCGLHQPLCVVNNSPWYLTQPTYALADDDVKVGFTSRAKMIIIIIDNKSTLALLIILGRNGYR